MPPTTRRPQYLSDLDAYRTPQEDERIAMYVILLGQPDSKLLIDILGLSDLREEAVTYLKNKVNNDEQ